MSWKVTGKKLNGSYEKDWSLSWYYSVKKKYFKKYRNVLKKVKMGDWVGKGEQNVIKMEKNIKASISWVLLDYFNVSAKKKGENKRE